MIITFNTENAEVSHEISDNIDVHEAMEIYRDILLTQGYHPVSIYRGFRDAAYDMLELIDSIKLDEEERIDE